MAQDVRISQILSGLAPLVAVAGSWLSSVNSIVPKPYLDEVFHVGQAQRYCEDRWNEWDSKITTPPGLYLIAQVARPWLCSIESLRVVNTVACSVLIPVLCILILRRISLQRQPTPVKTKGEPNDGGSLIHEGINIALFPPLFFFSGLFYTDPWSVLVVLAAYYVFLGSGPDSSNQALLLGRLQLTALGLLSLLFRQTNVFWVAIFLAGLDAVRWMKALNPSSASSSSLKSLASRSWNENLIHDPAIEDLQLEDLITAPLSLAIVGLRNIGALITVLLPYISILVAFAGFVAWNGGVVLGDKSNHVATIHLAQMLYVWPYILFFSFPVILRSAWTNASVLLKAPTSKPSLQILFVLLCSAGAMAAVVHFNTLVHPFTLADNRHYMFYVFRYFILGSHGAKIRYLLAPVYTISAFVVVGALGSVVRANSRSKTKSSTKGEPQRSVPSPSGESFSFLLVWLVSTVLSLVTAPLVEPRYFILPWIFWRLHLPQGKTKLELAVETALLLAINAVTGYVFLYRPFKWVSEPFSQQRFMW